MRQHVGGRARVRPGCQSPALVHVLSCKIWIGLRSLRSFFPFKGGCGLNLSLIWTRPALFGLELLVLFLIDLAKLLEVSAFVLMGGSVSSMLFGSGVGFESF